MATTSNGGRTALGPSNKGRRMACSSTHRRRREAFAVVARQDFFVRLVVVGEAEVGGVPAQFLAGEARGLHRQQCRLGDAPADLEWRPERLLVSQTIIRPVLPMIALPD